MKTSLTAVIVLWLGVSVALWLGYGLFRKRDAARQRKLVEDAASAIEEGRAFFEAIRKSGKQDGPPVSAYRRGAAQLEDEMRGEVRALLNAIERGTAFFDRVQNLKKKVQHTFGLLDFAPLSELLQIRRDFWAASEVLLMDDLDVLGAELGDEAARDAFRREAKSLLFHKSHRGDAAEDDAVALRLDVAREEAARFLADVDRLIAAEAERRKPPSLRETVAVPWRVTVGVAGAVREVSYLIADVAAAAQSLARTMSSSGIKGAVEELRRVRGDLPQQFATAFERAGGIGRTGGHSLKRHYEFLLEAQELRARYAELLARAPDLTDKGKQFLARLELEKRAEQFRESSQGAIAFGRQQLVIGIAHLIAGLQHIQAWITPRESKQLAPKLPEPKIEAKTASIIETPTEPQRPPLKVLLPPAPPAAPKSGSARRAVKGRPGIDVANAPGKPPAGSESAPRQSFVRLRDLVAGRGPIIGVSAEAPREPAEESLPPRKKPRFSYAQGMKNTSFKDLLANTAQDDDTGAGFDEPPPARPPGGAETAPRGGTSLLDRLATIGGATEVQSSEDTAPRPPKKSSKVRFRMFGSKRS